MRTLFKFDSWIARIESYLVVLLLAVMVLFAFGQIVLRNFFQQGILWADILLRQLVLWVGFLGASLAVRESRHIAIDYLPLVMPPAWKPRLAAFARLTAGLVSAFLTVSAWRFVMTEKEAGATLFLYLPGWWFQTILPVSFALISFRFLLMAFAPKST